MGSEAQPDLTPVDDDSRESAAVESVDAGDGDGYVVAKSAGEIAAEAAEAAGGFRKGPPLPPPAIPADVAAALAEPAPERPFADLGGEPAGDDEPVRVDERDVAADLGAIDPVAVPAVERPDGVPGFVEQYAGARLVDDVDMEHAGIRSVPESEQVLTTRKLRTPPPRKNPTSARILSEADRMIHGARAEEYGPAEGSFARIGAFWTTHLADKLKPGEEVDGYDVALLMVLMKVSRAATDIKDDTAIDIAGYAALSMRCAEYAGRTIREEHRG